MAGAPEGIFRREIRLLRLQGTGRNRLWEMPANARICRIGFDQMAEDAWIIATHYIFSMDNILRGTVTTCFQ